VSSSLNGRTAIVTGGAQGIGRACVHRFLSEGASVAFFDIDATEGERVAAAADDADRVLFVHCDLRSEPAVAAAVAQVTDRFGGTDILVNNAGVNAYFDATEMTADDWDSVFAIDLKAAWMCAKYTLPALAESGHGSIINVASIHALMTIAGMFPYAAAKSGLLGLSRSLALEYAHKNVRVNAICPGYVDTRLVQEWIDQQADSDVVARVMASLPLGRFAQPEEIASLIAYLASDDASYITGATLSIDGGLSARFAS
jgi:NAD(P)-dependent dehydrogenase (short-subunit alcohol dehydrogenase family)